MSWSWLTTAANYPSGTQAHQRIFFDAGGLCVQPHDTVLYNQILGEGIEFDQIFMWDFEKRSAVDYWDGTPEDVRAKSGNLARLGTMASL